MIFFHRKCIFSQKWLIWKNLNWARVHYYFHVLVVSSYFFPSLGLVLRLQFFKFQSFLWFSKFAPSYSFGQNKGKKLDFIFWGGQTKTKKKRKKGKRNDEICEMLVSWALDRSKEMRKLVADSFPKSPAWQNPKKTKKHLKNSGIPPCSPWTLA